jgi:hypothetical protein
MLEGTVTRPIAGVERGHGLGHTFAGMGKDWLTMHSEIEKYTIKCGSLNHVLQAWDWPSTWGWDYPMLAMTATRLGEPEKAVDALFINSQKNRYLANGHNFQSSRLPLYLPGNGGLLTAVAMMTAGWDGCPDRPSPGFPDNGKWNMRWEGLKRMP